jgi:hypothetical protein
LGYLGTLKQSFSAVRRLVTHRTEIEVNNANCLIICPKCKEVFEGYECTSFGYKLIQDLQGNEECLNCWTDGISNDYEVHSFDLSPKKVLTEEVLIIDSSHLSALQQGKLLSVLDKPRKVSGVVLTLNQIILDRLYESYDLDLSSGLFNFTFKGVTYDFPKMVSNSLSTALTEKRTK